MKRKILIFLTLFFIIIFIFFINHVYIKRMVKIPKDQWALKNIGQTIKGEKGKQGVDINISKAWNITSGDKNIIVSVVDTGVEDLDGIHINLYKNPIDSIDGMDNDNNGYFDDNTGWDFYNYDNTIYDDYLQDYHGTYLATTIVSHSKEMLGVAPGITILPVKFLSGSTGDVDDAVSALEYACNQGASIVNCSWGFDKYNNELYNVIKENPDVLFVCAAGNSNINLDTIPIYPACYDLDNIISVMAVDNSGKRLETSGYGMKVDIAAPGKNIKIMMPDNDITFISGTSVANAYVSGVAALILSYKNSLSPSEIIDIIKASSSKLEDLKGLSLTEGLINAYKCLIMADNY